MRFSLNSSAIGELKDAVMIHVERNLVVKLALSRFLDELTSVIVLTQPLNELHQKP